MGTRGRKSQADLSVVTDQHVESQGRPEPPADLTAEQSQEWNALVASQPADWLTRDRQGLATAYCRHVVSQRHIAQLIDNAENADEFDVAEYDKLLKMQERESGIIARLSVRLNIAHDTGREKKPKKNKLLEWQ